MSLTGIMTAGNNCPFCTGTNLTLNNEHKPIKLIQCLDCKTIYRLTQYVKKGTESD